LALNITGVDSLFIQQQPHINKQTGERDGQRLSRSGHAGPAAVFSFSQQALDSAKDAGRSQFGIRSQVGAPTATFRAAIDYGAEPVETAAALPPTAETAEARAAKADPPRREYWDASRLSTKSSSSSQSTSSPKNASNLEEVFVDVEHSESGYDNQIYWSDDGWETKHLIGVDDETKTVSLGKFERGAKIEFGIDNGQGEFYKTGRGSNNADGLRHAQVERHGNETRIGFEDLAGGGDRDFNDAIITVRRVAAEREDAPAVESAAEESTEAEAVASDGAEVTDAESTADAAPAEEAWAAEDPAPAEETWAAEGSAAAEETWASEDAGSTEETWGTEEAVSTEEPESAEQSDQQVSYQDLLDNVPMSFEDYFS
jgi:hypothetical protein